MVRDIFYKLKADDRENRLFLTDDNTIYLRLDNGYEILLHKKTEETYIECRHNSKNYVNYRINPDSMFEELSAYMEGRKSPPTDKEVRRYNTFVLVMLLSPWPVLFVVYMICRKLSMSFNFSDTVLIVVVLTWAVVFGVKKLIDNVRNKR